MKKMMIAVFGLSFFLASCQGPVVQGGSSSAPASAEESSETATTETAASSTASAQSEASSAAETESETVSDTAPASETESSVQGQSSGKVQATDIDAEMEESGIGVFVIEDSTADAASSAVYSLLPDDGPRVYAIRAKKDVQSFRLYRIDPESEGREELETLFSAERLSQHDYLLLSEIIPEGFPSIGFAWTNSSGKEFRRFVAESGLDGSLLLGSFEENISEARINEDGLVSSLHSVTGWGGDAGSSLKCASAATNLLSWSAQNPAWSAVTDLWVKHFLSGLNEEELRNFSENWELVKSDADAILNNFSSMESLLNDCGSLNAAREAADGDATMDHWEQLKSKVDSQLK